MNSVSRLLDPESFQFQFLLTLLALYLFTTCNACGIGNFISFLGTLTISTFLAWKITKLIQKRFFEKKLGAEQKAVLVTGCDTGFGHLLANKLNAEGYTVYAGCLNPTGRGPQDLLKFAKFPQRLHLLQLDVTKNEDIVAALALVKDSLQMKKEKLWGLVNNAGIAKFGLLEWGQISDYEKLFDVNVLGMCRVTRAFLPLLRKSKGRVVNVASLAGRIAVPGLGIYSMSKHAVVAFSEALRREMLPWGVKVISIEPAGYKTPMTEPSKFVDAAEKLWNETENNVKEDYGEDFFKSTLDFLSENKHGRDPMEVVEAMMDALTNANPEPVYRVCGLKYSFIWFLADYLPCSLTDKRFEKPRK